MNRIRAALCSAVLALLFATTAFAFSKTAEIHVELLPPEARATLALVRAGGPFAHKRDGSVFGNREGRLPKKSRGYYREYTVPTPASRDRGARRIVSGRAGEYYYTGDHYQSFRRILE